jgi:hypothetical protein
MLKLGEKQTITTPDGRSWTLGRLELRVVRQWKEWVAARVGDPFETVERFLGMVGDDRLMPMLRDAEKIRDQLRCFSMGCELSQRHLATEEGLAHFVGLLLKGAHPAITEEDVFAVAVEVNNRLAEVLQTAAGELPPNAGGPAPAVDGRASSTGGNSIAG